MAYRSRTYSPPRPARWMDLRYAGNCAQCGSSLPKGARAFYDPSDRTVCCTDMACAEPHGLTEEKYVGAPGSGRWVTVLSTRRIGGLQPDPFARTRSRGYYGRDAGRCEDAPCCGCCT
jgi:hypothetical protein